MNKQEPKSKEEMAAEAAKAVMEAQEKHYHFNGKDEAGNPIQYTMKESELDQKHTESLFHHLVATYNNSPAVVQSMFFADIISKMTDFMKANKHVGKRKYGYKNKGKENKV